MLLVNPVATAAAVQRARCRCPRHGGQVSASACFSCDQLTHEKVLIVIVAIVVVVIRRASLSSRLRLKGLVLAVHFLPHVIETTGKPLKTRLVTTGTTTTVIMLTMRTPTTATTTM